MRHGARLARRAGDAKRLLFVCYGNIMRSPFASAYFDSRAARGHRPGEAVSAGLYERNGRLADERAVAAGRRWDVDLSSHRSRTLDGQLVDWADLILVMDRVNLAGVRERYPAAAGKTYLLGAFDREGEPDVEIPDPFNAAYEATESAYLRIAGAIDRFVSSGHATPFQGAQ
jgi:protein-tyrosine phosphatase